MTGKIQHEIPQLYQRGFLIPGTGDAERIFVFRKDHEPFPSNINRSGAESYFYSPPPQGDEITLDDRITDYETHLGVLVRELRALSVGSAVDPQVAGEVIAHLTTRNAHLRGAFAHSLKTVAAVAENAFGSEQGLRHLVGINGPALSNRFRRLVHKLVAVVPQLDALGLPIDLMEKLVLSATRENFSAIFGESLPAIIQMLAGFAAEADNQAKAGHTYVLNTTLAPAERIDVLSRLVWRIVGPSADLILPDCVALGVEADGSVHPLMMVDSDVLAQVLLPLTSQSLLVGLADPNTPNDVSKFNAEAAACSHRYFLARADTKELRCASRHIGERSVLVVDAAIRHAVDELLPVSVAVVAEAPAPDTMSAPRQIAVELGLVGDFPPDLAAEISAELSVLLGAAAWTMPFSRLDGVTFADDYAQALADLDRGISGARPLTTRNDALGQGIAQAPVVVRNGVVMSHLIFAGDIARLLVHENETSRSWARSVMVRQLAQSGATEIVDVALPGVLLTQQAWGLEGVLQRSTYPAWNGYFAGRASAVFAADSFSETQILVHSALVDSRQRIEAARKAYLEHGSVDRLFDEALAPITFLLEHLAKLLGLADGLGLAPLASSDVLTSELEAQQLVSWLEVFRLDLEVLWNRRGVWNTYQEFLDLNRHAERLLWPARIFPFSLPDGRYGILVPPSLDLDSPSSL